jgi:hypothetical protein
LKNGLLWDYKSKMPCKDGWYAVLYNANSDEGMFSTYAYYIDGVCSKDLTMVAFSGPFLSQGDAEDWACLNNH